MTNSQKITELRLQIVAIQEDMAANSPNRLSIEDIESVSDNYQANLEYGWYVEEQEEIIADLQKQIDTLKVPTVHTFKPVEEMVLPVYEVGYVD